MLYFPPIVCRKQCIICACSEAEYPAIMFHFFSLNIINVLQVLCRRNILQTLCIYSYKTWGMFHKFPLIKYTNESLKVSLFFLNKTLSKYLLLFVIWFFQCSWIKHMVNRMK
jgi:hypothetical protein